MSQVHDFQPLEAANELQRGPARARLGDSAEASINVLIKFLLSELPRLGNHTLQKSPSESKRPAAQQASEHQHLAITCRDSQPVPEHPQT